MTESVSGVVLDAEGIRQRRQFASQVIRDAGRLAVDFWQRRESIAIDSKGPHDVVTQADKDVESFLRAAISSAFPGDSILGEEGGGSEGTSGQPLWILDPIDGTQEFARGTRSWCVVIAVVDARGCAIGVIFDPLADELFEADRMTASQLNGVPIHASTARSMGEGVVTIEYSPRQGPDVVLTALSRLLGAGGTFVRGGSGALGIAYVACGRSIGFVEAHMQPWDCLAAMLLVQQAGGRTNDFIGEGSMASGGRVIASCPALFDQVRFLLD